MPEEVVPPTRRASFREVSPRFLALPLFVLLAIEFALGILLNLYLTLPSGATVFAVLTSSAVLDLHIVFAVLIIGITARSSVIAPRSEDRRARWGSWLGLLSALLATAAGADFVFNGQNPTASVVMTIGFVGVLAGAIGMRLSGGTRGPSDPTSPPVSGAGPT